MHETSKHLRQRPILLVSKFSTKNVKGPPPPFRNPGHTTDKISTKCELYIITDQWFKGTDFYLYSFHRFAVHNDNQRPCLNKQDRLPLLRNEENYCHSSWAAVFVRLCPRSVGWLHRQLLSDLQFQVTQKMLPTVCLNLTENNINY